MQRMGSSKNPYIAFTTISFLSTLLLDGGMINI